MYDIIIIGAGPAGLTAAIYAARSGKSVLVYEKEGIGGQIAFSPRVENYPGIRSVSGSEFADNLYEQALSFGVDIELETVIGIKSSAFPKRTIMSAEVFRTARFATVRSSKIPMLQLSAEVMRL